MHRQEREDSIQRRLKQLQTQITEAEERGKEWEDASRYLIDVLSNYIDRERYANNVRPVVDPVIDIKKGKVRFYFTKNDRAFLEFSILSNGLLQAAIHGYDKDEDGLQTVNPVCNSEPRRAGREFTERALALFLDYCLEHHPSALPEGFED